MKKALLKVGYACNNNCIFCHSEPFRRHGELTTEDIEARIELAKRRGAEMIVFSGGEPTIRRDILELVRFAHGRGLKTGFATNGRRFIYPGFAKELRALGLGFAYLSFHSHARKTHELSARTDSFHQTLGALKNLVELGVEVTVNTIVTRCNIDDLPAAVDLLAALKPGKIKFSVVEPRGAALEDLSICPPLGASAGAIGEAIRRGRSKYPGIRFGCEGLTPCLLDDFEGLNDDLITNGFILFQEAFECGPSAPDYGNRSKERGCVDCRWADRCPGVFTGYLSMTPPPALRPEARPRSNSFVFLKGGSPVPVPESATACPARGAGLRRIFLAEKNRMRAYETSTKDFSGAEIKETLDLGQLYAVANGKHRRLDYGRDLIKLSPAPVCLACERKGSCSRIYEATKEKVFEPLETALERLVRRLEGDVLEVGCGAVRFGDIIEARARAGRLRYVGIDPELPRRRSQRGMRLLRVDIENFDASDAAFDHVLILRSYNHIRLPSVAFPKIHRALRPGGSLTVVDGAACGLVLAREPGSAGPGDFQHFRNHTSRQARAMLESFGFGAIAEIPVEPAGCSEWLLDMRRK